MEKSRAARAAEKGAFVLAVAAGYYALARAGLLLALPGTASSTVWPASGFAIAAALTDAPLAALGVLLGSWLANARLLSAAAATGTAAAAAIGLSSAAQAYAGAALFRRFLSPKARFLDKARDVAVFAALTPLVCLLAATVGNGTLVAAGLLSPAAFRVSWLAWWIGDALGVLIACPLLLAWSARGRDDLARSLRPARALETAAALTLVGLVGWAGFGDSLRRGAGHPLSYLTFPLLIWTTLRLDARGVTAAVAVLAAVVQWRTAHGAGPFAAAGADGAASILGAAYLAGATLTAYLLRALLSQLHEAQAALQRRVQERDDDLWNANATLRVAALERQEHRERILLYSRLVEKLPIGVAVVRAFEPEDPATWRIVELNPAGKRLSADGGDGRPFFDFASADGAELTRACVEVLRAGEERAIPDYECPRRAPGAHFALGAFPLGDGLVGIVFEDTTAQRVAQDSLRRGEEQMRHMIESVQDYAIFRLDPEGRIVSWNQGAQKITGYAADEILGQPYGRLLTEEDARAGKPAALLRQAEAAGRTETEGWRVRKDGAQFWTNSVLTVMRDGDGRLEGYVKVLRDVTERRLVEQALQEKTDALARSNVELTQFAYVASHDLQEPLRKVAAFAELLRERLAGRLDETDLDFMTRLLKSVEGMQNLIDALLKLARVNTAETATRPVDMTALAKEVAEQLDVSLAGSGGRISVEPLPTVDADPQQMRQLLQNLLSNAIKFRSPGRAPDVRVYGRVLEDGRPEVCVSDDGVGFDMRYAQRLFQPFQRLHSRKDFPGTGMGLAICHKIVARHGGTLAAESAVGRGATFKVAFPAGRLRTDAEAVGGASWNKE